MSLARGSVPAAIATTVTRMAAALERGAAKRRVVWVLVGLGALLRVRLWLANQSLDVAEAMLALNLQARDLAGLAGTLDHHQAAPLLFLWIERAACVASGGAEWALRAFPLAASLIALVWFQRLAVRLLRPAAVSAAVLLFAFSPGLILYAAQTKQYSSDVALALGLLLLALPAVEAPLSGARAVALAGAGALALWLSHAAIPVLAGTGVVLAGAARARRDGRTLARLVGVGTVWSASFLALWAVSLRHLVRDDTLLAYWAADFLPFPPHGSADLRWPVDAFFRVFQDPGALLFPGLAGALFAVGGLRLGARRPGVAALLAAPILVTVAASAFHQFPFGRRVILFLVPVLLLGVALGLEAIDDATRERAPHLALLLLAVLAFDSVLSGGLHLVRPRPTEEVREALVALRPRLQAGDRVYVYFDAQYAYRWYAPRLGLDTVPVVFGRSAEAIWSDDLADLESLRGEPRVWLLFSHVFDRDAPRTERDFFLFEADRMGRALDAIELHGTSLHLYDLRGVSGGAEAPGPGAGARRSRALSRALASVPDVKSAQGAAP